MGRVRTKIGDTFGIHTVVKIFLKYNGTGATYVEITCPCGETHIVHLGHLKEKNRATCNCDATGYKMDAKFDGELIGKKFGELTIIEVLRGIDYKHAYCVCTCSCKNEIIAMKTNVIRGNTNSCGCHQKRKAGESNTKDWTGVISDYGVKFIERGAPDKRGVFKWKCLCPVCGETFEKLPNMIMSGQVKSCGCIKSSWGECIIDKYLKDNHVKFKKEFSFKDCRGQEDALPLRFDFALLDSDENPYILIEYDGFQHKGPVDFFGGIEGYEIRKKHDIKKDEYCKNNCIPLYRIEYGFTEIEIKEILEYILSSKRR